MKKYITVQGDKWDSIAFNQMGTTEHTDKLMNANTRYIDIFVFPAGVEIEIPDVNERNYDDMPPWKRVGG